MKPDEMIFYYDEISNTGSVTNPSEHQGPSY